MNWEAYMRYLGYLNRLEMERAGFKPEVTRPPRRPVEESSQNYRQQMKDAGRGHLLG